VVKTEMTSLMQDRIPVFKQWLRESGRSN